VSGAPGWMTVSTLTAHAAARTRPTNAGTRT
jgi:hypothetical protein